MSVEEFISEALEFSVEERASIASQFLHSSPITHYAVSDEEVASRVQEAEANDEILISFDEFVGGIEHRAGPMLS